MQKIFIWLSDENNRGVVSLASGAIAVCVAALWSLYLYFYPPTKLPEVSIQRTILICKGDTQTRCPSNSIFISCSSNYEVINQIASDECGNLKDALVRRLIGAPGGRCGYSISEITCSVKS